MKRVFWTVGMGTVGLLLGLKGQDTPSDIWWTALGTIWGAGIGYGLGTIFDQARPTRHLVMYWAATLVLVGLFFGLLIGAGVQPYASVAQRTVAGLVGALAGMLFGLFVGKVQLRRLNRKSQDSHLGTAS
jgi:membrane protein YqaA with SNARE-associated domain